MDKVECYFQVAHSQLQRQDGMNRDLEAKAIRSIGGAAALIGVAAIILRILSADDMAELANGSVQTTIALGAVFLVALGFSLAALWPRKWRNDPDLEKFATHLAAYDDEQLVRWAGNQSRNAVAVNRRILKLKSAFLIVSIVGLSVMAALVLVLAGLNI